MTYWMQGAATNPTGAFVCVAVFGTAALVVLKATQTVRPWLKKLSDQAAFMIPHHIGTSSNGRSIAPGVFVVELRRTMVVGYAADIKDADQVCQMNWLRDALKCLIIDDAQVWNGKAEITAREAAASEKIRFMNAMQNRDGILLDLSAASALLNFVMVDRDRQRLVRIGRA